MTSIDPAWPDSGGPRRLTPSSLFLTHALAPHLRFEAWRDSVGVFLQCSLLPIDDPDSFNGRVESYLLDGLVLSRPSANRQKFDRPAELIARDGMDAYMIQLVMRGGIDMHRGGRRLERSAGQVVAFDCGEVLDSVNSDFDLIALVVPRVRLADRLTHPDAVHGEALARSAFGTLVARHMADVFAVAPCLDAPEAATVAEGLLDLLAAGFNATVRPGSGRVDPAATDDALFLRARLFIRERVDQPDLDPDGVAAALGISRSRLYAAFQRSGGVAAYIRDLRLRRCFSDLRAARNADLTVAEVAFRWGFSSAPVFTRAFRDRFGCSPSEVRQAGHAAVVRDRRPVDPVVGDRLYEDWILAAG